MKLVIDIDEKIYRDLQNRGLTGMLTAKECECMNEAIYNGTPLPKGHGDLIDRDELLNTLEKLEWIRTNCSVDEDNTNILENIICEVPTVIEADDEYDDVYGHWLIPEKLLPTQKQKDFADKISKRLHKDISKLTTKHQYWEFINNNKDDYFAAWKEFRDAEYGYDGDLYDFNPEYDMDWF